MTAKLVQIHFTYELSHDAFARTVRPLADLIATQPGLLWKIWLVNEAASEAEGLYLFESAAAARAYLNGPIATQIAAHPALRDLSIKQFDIMEEVTAITRGPVRMPA